MNRKVTGRAEGMQVQKRRRSGSKGSSYTAHNRRRFIMRKKSHISLAKYIVNNVDDNDLKKHRFSFYVGSILPDIKPSFVYKRHEIEGTYPYVSQHIKRLTEGRKLVEKKKSRKYYRDLGQVSHYLADYFTYPHNKIYPGTLKAHCSYEEKLKRDLRSYLKSKESTKHRKHVEFTNAESLCDFIEMAHHEYLVHKHGVEDDIQNIVDVNYKALSGMMELLSKKQEEFRVRHS